MLYMQPLTWFLQPPCEAGTAVSILGGREPRLRELSHLSKPTQFVCSRIWIQARVCLAPKRGLLTAMLCCLPGRASKGANRLHPDTVKMLCYCRNKSFLVSNGLTSYGERIFRYLAHKKGLVSYMLLFFASQPFNHLKLSVSVHTSEMCWSFFPMHPSWFI